MALPMKQPTPMIVQVEIIAMYEPEPADQAVPGRYQVALDPDVELVHAADVAAAIVRDAVAIRVPENFVVNVRWDDVVLYETDADPRDHYDPLPGRLLEKIDDSY